MIESVEKQKQILDMLNKWAKNCKIKWLLRNNDLNMLSWDIIEQFYNCQLSCGHLVREPYREYVIEMPDYNGAITSSYCEDCGKEELKRKDAKLLYMVCDGEIIYNKEKK